MSISSNHTKVLIKAVQNSALRGWYSQGCFIEDSMAETLSGDICESLPAGSKVVHSNWGTPRIYIKSLQSLGYSHNFTKARNIFEKSIKSFCQRKPIKWSSDIANGGVVSKKSRALLNWIALFDQQSKGWPVLIASALIIWVAKGCEILFETMISSNIFSYEGKK